MNRRMAQCYNFDMISKILELSWPVPGWLCPFKMNRNVFPQSNTELNYHTTDQMDVSLAESIPESWILISLTSLTEVVLSCSVPNSRYSRILKFHEPMRSPRLLQENEKEQTGFPKFECTVPDPYYLFKAIKWFSETEDFVRIPFINEAFGLLYVYFEVTIAVKERRFTIGMNANSA